MFARLPWCASRYSAKTAGKTALTGIDHAVAMKLSRRALLLAAPVVMSRTAHASPAPLRLEPAVEGMVALTGPGIRQPLLLPGRGARLLPALRCGGELLSVVVVALEEAGAVLDWAVVALALDDQVALLALEPLAWRGAAKPEIGAPRLATRFSTTGDRSRVQWQREAAVPESPTLWRREAWTDYLAWAPPCGLADAPVRAPRPGTHQHLVAQWRQRAAALVASAPRAVTPELLASAGLQAANFSLAVSATPLMRQPSGPRIIV